MKTKLYISALFFSSVLVSYGQWTYTDLSEPKSGMGSASLGTKAYFAGGYTGSGYSSKVEAYDVITKLWNTIGNLSEARYMVAGVSCGSRIFFAGGFDWTQSFATIDIYSTLTNQWTVKQLSVDRFNMAALSYGSKVLFAGGCGFPQFPNITWYDIVDIYDTLTGQWSTAYLSQPREGIAAAVVDDLAIFAGGNAGSVTTTDVVDIYNFTTGTWITATLSLARSQANATTVGNKVIIAGGVTSSNNPTDQVDIYDASTDTWTTANLSWPRSSIHSNAATVNGKAYIAGGGVFIGNGFDSPSDVIDIYDPQNDTWSKDNLSEPLLDHSVLGIGNYLVVAGGQNYEGNIVSTVGIFFDPSPGITSQPNEGSFFRVYPNPSNGHFHLELSAEFDQKTLLAILYNLQGQMVFNQTLAPGDRELNLNLPSGVYLLKVISGESTQQKLISI